MRYLDGFSTWLGLICLFWTVDPPWPYPHPSSLASSASLPLHPGSHPPSAARNTPGSPIHSPSMASQKYVRPKTVSESEEREMVSLLVELQKRTEEKEGIGHTLKEEESVNIFFEDDILLTVEQAEELLKDMSRRRKRKLAEALAKRWTPPIPYMFDGSHSSQEMYRIRQALSYWEEVTCITFREDSAAERKLLFVRGPGCWSYVGFTNQVNQTVSIDDGCQSNGTIAHEVGHAVGFWHEQSRPDRDPYILIHRHNVTEGKMYNFEARTWGEIETLEIPYDLGSAMHYGSKFYAKDPNGTYTTVETKDPLMTRVIGQRLELSFYDVKLANKAYCEGVCATYNRHLPQPCRREGYQDPKDCYRCRCPAGFAGTFCDRVAPSVNAFCGGVLQAGTTPGWIYSPGYPNPGYRQDVQCSWLIQAPESNRVYFEFVGDFGISGNEDVCRDFVEIRYNTSLSLTGARFCLRQPPRSPIVSTTNEMLVLFRSYAESRVCDDRMYPWKCNLVYTGFRAKFYYKSCGGCQSSASAVQPACVRRVSYTCAQEWTEKVKIDCPRWWYTESCGERTVNKVRYSVCFQDQYHCCGSFNLDGTECKISGAAQKRSFNVIPPTSDNPPLSDDVSENFQTAPPLPSAPAVRWSDWGDWGICSRSCGGGVRVRTRRCIAPGFCGASNLQVDKQPCNQSPCMATCLVQKSIICDMWTRCTRTVQEPCKKCAEGHALTENVCIARAG